MEKPSDVSQELRSLRNYNLYYKAASDTSDDGELIVSIPNTVTIEPISKGNEKIHVKKYLCSHINVKQL
jgi:hypothetical protein